MAVSLTINGIEVQAEPGMTVLQAAQAAGIYIPTLCYHPKLAPVGACRMCVVQIEGLRGFPTACTVPANAGMVVQTETEALQNLRREILSLILSEHPYTCLVCKEGCDLYQLTIRKAAATTGCQYCPKNAQCELQNLVDYLGMKDVAYPIAYRGLKVEHEDPFFDRDYNLCILCGRCVRMCQDVRHAGVLAFINRGSHTVVGTAFGRSHLDTNCQFCGACVDVCPTGALYDKRGKWEGVPTGTTASICPYCSVGCAVNVETKSGKVIRTVGLPDAPVNDGQLCNRGRFAVVDVVHSLARLKTPLVRRNGRLVEVPWAEAIEAVRQGLSPHRGDSFAALGSAVATNEESYLLQKFTRAVMGSNNVALAAGYPEFQNGSGKAANPFPLLDTLRTLNSPAVRAIRNAGCILVIGSNVFNSHPILGLEIKHAISKGACLIAVDNRHTPTTAKANFWLKPRLATDAVLLAGLIKAGTTPGQPVSPAQARVLAGLPDLAQVAAVTGVAEADIASAANCLSRHAPLIIIYGSGVTHQPTAPATIKAITALAALSDQTWVMGLPGEGNFVGAHDMGLHPALLPGYFAVSNPAARAIFEAAWGVQLNPTPGRSYEGIVAGLRQGEIKALYLAGEVPPMPELAGLEFLVVQDVLPTDNLGYASVVLPATTFVEMDGTMTNLEGRVQRMRQAIPAPGLTRPGWNVLAELARQMPLPEYQSSGNSQWNYASVAEVTAEIAALVPAYAGVSYKTLGPAGLLRRFEPGSTPPVAPLDLDHLPQFSSPEFPLTLVTERNLLYYHGASLTEEVKGMNRIKQEEVLELNAADAASLGIANGDLVNAVSEYGSAECLVHVNGSVPAGVVFGSFNRLSGSPLFPNLAPGPKASAIRIEKA